MVRVAALVAAGLMLLPSLARAHEVHADMAQAAAQWMAGLTPAQRTKAVLPFEEAERLNWHFIPRGRKGLPLKEMTPAQRRLALALLRTGLSAQGFDKAEQIISLENVLKALEAARPPAFQRDPELYYLTLFGVPGEARPWAWRFEGHHLSLSFTVVGQDAVAFAPSFFGSNPAEVRDGPAKGLTPLMQEEALGRALATSLRPDQRRVAVLATSVPRDILNVPGRAGLTEPQGIAAAALTAVQRRDLTRLIRAYLDRHRPELAAGDWARIEAAGLDKVSFVWIGGLARGEPHYYRVQGPTFVLEYDNTQNGANHAHSVWRDAANDFGEDLLKRHYSGAHR